MRIVEMMKASFKYLQKNPKVSLVKRLPNNYILDPLGRRRSTGLEGIDYYNPALAESAKKENYKNVKKEKK